MRVLLLQHSAYFNHKLISVAEKPKAPEEPVLPEAPANPEKKPSTAADEPQTNGEPIKYRQKVGTLFYKYFCLYKM